MRTAGDIAGRALIRAGVIASGETPTAAELSDAVTTLSDMLDSWSLEALTVFGTTEHVISLTGAQQYTIGPRVTWWPRGPLLCAAALCAMTAKTLICTFALPSTWTSSAAKACKGRATGSALRARCQTPRCACGRWLEGELHLRVSQPLVQLTDINDELDLPPGWFHAMVLNLAVHLCEEYGFALAQGLVETAQTAKANIKRANLKPARSRFDAALL